MLQAALLSLAVFLVRVPALEASIQVPFDPNHDWLHETHAVSGNELVAEWNFDIYPNPNDTDHLVFETVHSFLQHWPNTRMRNGHNIVPGVIPKGTLLYHGTNRKELPPGPEWVATDPEHSYLFCRDGFRFNYFDQGCWHLTVATVRPLKVVYFDGSSAAKMPYGSMDTQDLIAWGETSSSDVYDERRRIEDLCNWGKRFGVDGFVRMEMDFEVMLCDFTSGVSIVSFANLPNRNGPPMMSSTASFEVMNSGSWHNHFPGETRIKLDLTGLVSFYDTQFVSSLVPVRAGQERWDHRVGNISSEDLSALKSRLEETLTKPSDLSSGIDWITLVQVIVDRFSGRLELTHYLLNTSTTDPDEILDVASKTQTQLRIMLTPYILFGAVPTGLSDKANLDWSIPIYKLCATTHTSFMESYLDNMTASEKLLLQAVRGTSREICRVVTKMWATGVYAGIDPSLNTVESPDIAEVTQVWATWWEELNRLMAWLDWNIWVKCNPECGSEEMCYLPTWPAGFPRPKRGPPPPLPSDPDRQPTPSERPGSFELRNMVIESLAEELSNIIEPEPEDWVRPQPRCVRRVSPYNTI